MIFRIFLHIRDFHDISDFSFRRGMASCYNLILPRLLKKRGSVNAPRAAIPRRSSEVSKMSPKRGIILRFWRAIPRGEAWRGDARKPGRGEAWRGNAEETLPRRFRKSRALREKIFLHNLLDMIRVERMLFRLVGGNQVDGRNDSVLCT